MIPLSPRVYALGFAFVLFLGLGVALKVQTNRLAKARSQIAIIDAANEANLATIAMQTGALAQWKKLAADMANAATVAQANAKAYRAKANELALAQSQVKENDRAIPECAALLATNLRTACPGIAYGLRQLEIGDQSRRGTGTGARNSPVKPNRRLRAEVQIQR